MKHERLGFFILGALAGVAIMFGCAASPIFPYHYYALSMPNECYNSGLLLGKVGKDGWRDLPLETCRPDPKGNNLKCIVVLDGDFYNAKGDYLKCQQDLANCQKNCK